MDSGALREQQDQEECGEPGFAWLACCGDGRMRCTLLQQYPSSLDPFAEGVERSSERKAKRTTLACQSSWTGLDWCDEHNATKKHSGEQGAIGRWRKKLYKWANTTLAAARGESDESGKPWLQDGHQNRESQLNGGPELEGCYRRRSDMAAWG